MKLIALLLLTSLPLGALLGGCTTGQESGPTADVFLANTNTGAHGLADYDRGKHYLASGDYGLAIDAFEKALAEDAGSADAMNGLAIAYDRIGRKDDAAMFLNKALALDPRSAYTLNNFAYFHQSHGEQDQAMAYFARARAALAAAPKAEAPRTLPTIVANNLAAMSSPEPVAPGNMAGPVSARSLEANPPSAAALTSAITIPTPPSVVPAAQTTPSDAVVPSAVAPIGVALLATASVPETLSANIAAVPIDAPLMVVPALAAPSKSIPSSVPARSSELAAVAQSAQSTATGTKPLDHVTLRIANLTGRPHMARRFAGYLESHGMPSRHLINVQNDNRAQSTIYYSRGLENAAKALARLVPVPVQMFGLSNDYHTVELMLAPDLQEFDRSLSSSSSAST